MTNRAPSTASDLLNALCHPEDEGCGCYDSRFPEAIAEAKRTALANDDESEAFMLWCVQTIDLIQRGFIAAFESLKEGSYYQAWCQFERCEIEMLSLKRHHAHAEGDPHRIAYIEEMIRRWQALYPYKVFFSPELLKKRVECSICGAKVSPSSQCGHEKGAIYRGEMCHHRVTEVQMLSISVVKNPVQRYSVAFLSSGNEGEPKDHYDYGNVKFVVDRLESPFHGWDSFQTTRTIAASDVAHLDQRQLCPCLSGKAFGECCGGKSELTVPHLQIRFYVQPSRDLPAIELLC